MGNTLQGMRKDTMPKNLLKIDKEMTKHFLRGYKTKTERNIDPYNTKPRYKKQGKKVLKKTPMFGEVK